MSSEAFVVEHARDSIAAASNDRSLHVEGLGKCYQIYATPRDRLKQFVVPRLSRILGREPRKYFTEYWALRGVSLDIYKGETVGIVGRNGSGKSTLLQIVCGTLSPTEGHVETNGRIAALLELGSGFNPEFTGRENVYMNGAVLGLDRKEIDQRFDSIASFAEIGEHIEQPVKTYSSGMVVRLAFSVAINVDPEILVVDEALAVGDERFQRKCFARIHDIRARGATILLVSHSGSTIVELCDRAILIDDGEVVTSGPPKQVVANYQRLLFAPQHARASIRERIREAGAYVATATLARVAQVGRAQEFEGGVEDWVKELFDPHLKPTSTIEYESRGAIISSPEVRTLEGEQVNVLVGGRSYKYKYSVQFTQPAIDVRFGMLIKTISGVELGGGTSSLPGRESLVLNVEAGTVYHVEFEFCCHLNPGVYFLNAGVRGTADGEDDQHLHRLIDAAMFRVMLNEPGLATGIVDFRCRATYARN